MTAEADAWEGKKYGIDHSRFCEYTSESVRQRFRKLSESAIRELISIPAILAYEAGVRADAQIARISHVLRTTNGEIRFRFEIDKSFAPISAEKLESLAWELDIVGWELNRTHWAIKEIDLLEVLAESGAERVETTSATVVTPPAAGEPIEVRRDELRVSPRVFAIPAEPVDPSLVSVMMPFDPAFDSVFGAIRTACERAGFRCERADDVWIESTIIQDVFSLIYRSRFVIVDLTNRNSNVLYETGIAHTLGRPVVPIAQDVRGLPFDLAQHRTLEYEVDTEGLRNMMVKIERRLRQLAS